MYDNSVPQRVGRVWLYNGKKQDKEIYNEIKNKENMTNMDQNLVTKGRHVGVENVNKTIQNKREIGLIKMMLENKKNVIAQLDQTHKEREEGLYDSEKLLEKDLKRFMECFQNLKIKKQEVKDKNVTVLDKQNSQQKKLNELESESNQWEAKKNDMNQNITELMRQKSKIFILMKDWNEDTIPNPDDFMDKIKNLRQQIVDLTDRIEEEREEINTLKEIYIEKKALNSSKINEYETAIHLKTYRNTNSNDDFNKNQEKTELEKIEGFIKILKEKMLKI